MLAAISTSTAKLLTASGWATIALTLLMILVPYLRGRRDLATAWNFVLVGCALFMGVSCLEAADPPKLVFEDYVSFDFPDADYKAMLLRQTVFLACLFGFYYLAPIGRRFASNRFTNSPPWSPTLFVSLMAVCGITAGIGLVMQTVNIGFVREVFMNLGHKGAVFAVAFAFYAWFRNRTSPAALIIFLLVFASAVLYVMRVSHGRRLLLCVAFAPIAVMYWTNWRYKSRIGVVAMGSVAITLVVFMGMWYHTFRFYDRGKHAAERNFANTIQAAKQVSFSAIAEQFDNWEHRLAQGTFRYGLMTKRLVDSGKLTPHTLNTLQFVLSYPIPRRYWEEKPEALGAIIVTDVITQLPHHTNWGLGVAGQAYYEGDWFAIVIYALLLVMLVWLVDEPLKREPNNPFFIAVCAASSLFLVTWPRGDLGVHTNEVLECFIFAWILRICGGLMEGSKPSAYARDFGSALLAAKGRLPIAR